MQDLLGRIERNTEVLEELYETYCSLEEMAADAVLSSRCHLASNEFLNTIADLGDNLCNKARAEINQINTLYKKERSLHGGAHV